MVMGLNDGRYADDIAGSISRAFGGKSTLIQSDRFVVSGFETQTAALRTRDALIKALKEEGALPERDLLIEEILTLKHSVISLGPSVSIGSSVAEHPKFDAVLENPDLREKLKQAAVPQPDDIEKDASRTLLSSKDLLRSLGGLPSGLGAASSGAVLTEAYVGKLGGPKEVSILEKRFPPAPLPGLIKDSRLDPDKPGSGEQGPKEFGNKPRDPEAFQGFEGIRRETPRSPILEEGPKKPGERRDEPEQGGGRGV
jgi:hypothetical protein